MRRPSERKTTWKLLEECIDRINDADTCSCDAIDTFMGTFDESYGNSELLSGQHSES